MIFENPEQPVPYEPLSYDDEITEEFQILEKVQSETINNHKSTTENLGNECFNCRLIYQSIYLYYQTVNLCINCCYLYDKKYKCDGCNNINITDVWYRDRGQFLCNSCNSCNVEKVIRREKVGRICNICNIFKEQIT